MKKLASINLLVRYVLTVTLIVVAFSIAPASLSKEENPSTDNQGARNVNEIEIINNLYSALNGMELDAADTYLADDVEMITLYRPLPPIVGKEEVSQLLRKMLLIAKNSNFVFVSGPFEMGDVVTVEYMHHYDRDGESHVDHNVSIFIFENRKIKKWLGYIHQ